MLDTISEALDLRRHEVLLRENVSIFKAIKCRSFVRKQLQGIPLAYLSGKSHFYEDVFLVGRDIFIPRPETEMMVEYLSTDRGFLTAEKILDIGTGSGNIAVSLAKKFPDKKITAVDISSGAVRTAALNAGRILGSGHVLELVKCDIRDHKFSGKFDFIVSNPPYIAENDPEVADSVYRYEPHEALFAGSDGLDFYRLIATRLTELLSKGGGMMLEFGYKQADKVKISFKNFDNNCIIKDNAGLDRFFYGSGYDY